MPVRRWSAGLLRFGRARRRRGFFSLHRRQISGVLIFREGDIHDVDSRTAPLAATVCLIEPEFKRQDAALGMHWFRSAHPL